MVCLVLGHILETSDVLAHCKTCDLFYVTHLTTICSLIGEGTAQGSSNRMSGEMFDMGSKMKKLMFIDVFTISLGFILRLCAGFRILHKPVGESCNIWFILFVMFLTLFIGIGKRCSEIKLLGNDSAGFRESLNGCSIAQLEQLIIMLMTCTIMSYAIFVYTSEIKALFTTAPVLMYGIFRYHFLNEKSTIAGSPELIVYKDRPMRACLLLWAVLFVSICIVRSYTV